MLKAVAEADAAASVHPASPFHSVLISFCQACQPEACQKGRLQSEVCQVLAH